MRDLFTPQPSPERFGAGIKVAALVITLGSIALAADLAWLAPGHVSVQANAPATVAAPAGDPAEYRGYPAPSTPPGAETGEPIQAF